MTTTHTGTLEDLTIALLAVNNYPLEKADKLLDKLRSHDWMDSAKVATWTHDQAIKALVASGYDRGATMNSIFASRLQELALFTTKHGLQPLEKALKAKDKPAAETFLLKIHGIGPAVVRNFWILQNQD